MTVAHLETTQADTAAPVPVLLTAAYRRLDAMCEALSVQIAEPGPPSARTVGLTEGQESVEAFVDAEAASIREHHDHTAPRHVAASRALHDYAWSVGLLMSGVWFLERRVPRVAPGDIRGTRLIPERLGDSCCGLDGADGSNSACEACGSLVATRFDSC